MNLIAKLCPRIDLRDRISVSVRVLVQHRVAFLAPQFFWAVRAALKKLSKEKD